MGFELFIGFIQAYVFFVLTVIFTALAVDAHGGNKAHADHTSQSEHSSAPLGQTPSPARE
jgi:F-type H+-transporting ATPase subunit a